MNIEKLTENNEKLRKHHQTLLYLGTTVILIAAILLLINARSWMQSGGKSKKSSIDQMSLMKQPGRLKERPETMVRRAASDKSAEKYTITPEDDPSIVAVMNSIKTLESRRIKFCRETENDRRVLQQFVIDYPSQEEVTKIQNLIVKTNGLTKDQNGRLITWRQRLGQEFLWPEEFTKCILSTEYDKNTGKGHYTIIGVRKDNLLMRDGNAPMPADGSINILYSDVSFSYKSNWRFSNLFAIDDKTSKQ